MKILIAFEESQAVCIEMRKRGHEAYSCDLLPCSGGHPEWHIEGDIKKVLKSYFPRNIGFWVESCGYPIYIDKWDMIIAFVPCTDLAVSGARWFKEKIADGRQQKSIKLFLSVIDTDSSKVAIENPIGIMSTKYRKPDQIIQPWQFGHGETKATCLWLRGLPKLKPTNIVPGREQRIWKMAPGPERAKERSKTFPGIARAMAEQWTEDITLHEK